MWEYVWMYASVVVLECEILRKFVNISVSECLFEFASVWVCASMYVSVYVFECMWLCVLCYCVSDCESECVYECMCMIVSDFFVRLCLFVWLFLFLCQNLWGFVCLWLRVCYARMLMCEWVTKVHLTFVCMRVCDRMFEFVIV